MKLHVLRVSSVIAQSAPTQVLPIVLWEHTLSNNQILSNLYAPPKTMIVDKATEAWRT